MPAPLVTLWPFIRELFFNRKTIWRFILVHRLAMLFGLSSVVMFGLLMFMTEQDIRQEIRWKDDTRTIDYLKGANGNNTQSYKDKLDQCVIERDAAQDNYRTLSHSLSSPVPSVPTTPKNSQAQLPWVLPPKDYSTRVRNQLKDIEK